MKKLITIAALALIGLLAGCANAQPAARASTCAGIVADDFSVINTYMSRAISQMRAGTITVQQASQVLVLVRAGIAELDAACPHAQGQLDAARHDRARAAIGEIAAMLTAAVEKAEAAGQPEIDLLAELRAKDDAARADLAKAIEEAVKGAA